MKLFKTVMIITSMAVGLGAMSPAFAQTSRNDCIAMRNIGFASMPIALKCARYIPGEGIISYGKNEGKTWGGMYDDKPFVYQKDNELNKLTKPNATMHHSGSKFKWGVYYQDTGWQSSPATKEISEGDILRHIRENKLDATNLFRDAEDYNEYNTIAQYNNDRIDNVCNAKGTVCEFHPNYTKITHTTTYKTGVKTETSHHTWFENVAKAPIVKVRS